MEEPKKNNSFLYLVIIIILLMALSGLGGYIIADKVINKDSNGSSTSENKNNNEKAIKITDTEKKAILDIIELTENGVVKEEFDGHNATDYFSFQSVMRRLDKTGTFKIDDLPVDTIEEIILTYALDKSLTSQVSGDDYEFCEAGSGWCTSVTFEDYAKIAKALNIRKDPKTIFGDRIYNNNYLFTFGGSVDSGLDVTDSVSFKEETDNVKVIYNINATYSCVDGNCNKSATINRVYTYTFKKDSSNSYYLDTISIKNN